MAEKILSTEIIKRYFPLEFQISKKGWEYYEFDKGIFPEPGKIKLPNFQILRQIVKRIYERKDFKIFSHQPIRAGELNAIGLINDILRYILNAYRITKNPHGFSNCLNYLTDKITTDSVDNTINSFADLFPPYVVQLKRQSIPDYIEGRTEEVLNSNLITKEIILLYLANNNPGFSAFLELFSDSDLGKTCPYTDFFNSLTEFFKAQPGFGPKNKPIIDFLKEPILASPYSLEGQLTYIKDNWSSFLPEELLTRILMTLDILKEERKLGFLGPGPSVVLKFKGIPEYEEEYERFTKDKDWMSKVVLIAKCTYVWLDQLSKKYQRQINKLDQIPDEELDILSRWGFTGLWLIGLWERSPASGKIKQICGNPEALSSAYSIYDYKISDDIGGDSALQNLKHRAWRRGIIIATDIVPNHTGIYSKWAIEHPDWFIQLNYPPFPSYSFTGPDLSWDPRVGLYIEDGYWERRDAAVVFKRVDKWTGDTRYIYHGNDGTSMPWNDTAQLNFLLPYVREAVIQNILNIAKNFPIIRLDAAMTLTKRHYQRLWFPHPGTGGGIPSRTEHGMYKEDLDKLMPKEFWREVVDRINSEAPDTLLIAEAFWLMEGYFVRTLGMHRVYNSAFMNMLKTEENANYRSVIKNVIEFNPEILRRFVNFMNNPDEETAIAQFGKGDKYFGACLMMVTLPGLPMFGHGQIEGFTEKYGMEYRRSYWNEEIDWDLVRRHEHEIFPLIRKRHLFSGVENFVLYDFFRPDGYVNENIFAYSNRCGDERALIIYNNKYEHAVGWVRTSCAFSVGGEKPSQRNLIQKTLGEGLGLKNDWQYYYIFRDHKTGLEYIRQGKEIHEKGIYIELGAFGYHIFIDFREVIDTPLGYYSRLCQRLNGRGVPSIEEALKEMIFSPVHNSFRNLINKETLQQLMDQEYDTFKRKTIDFIKTVKEFAKSDCDENIITEEIMEELKSIIKLKDIKAKHKPSLDYLTSQFKEEINFWKIPFTWLITHNLGKICTMDELLLGPLLAKIFREFGHDEWTSVQEVTRLKILTSYHNWFSISSEKNALKTIKNMFNDSDVQQYLNFNTHNGVLWFSKEKFEDLCYWLFILSAINNLGKINNCYKIIIMLLQKAGESGYKVHEMLELVKD